MEFQTILLTNLISNREPHVLLVVYLTKNNNFKKCDIPIPQPTQPELLHTFNPVL